MHKDAHPFIFRIRPLRDAQMMGQGIDERAAEMSVAWMNHHSRILVHHKKVIVFIHDVQRYVFRKYLKAATLVRHHESNHIAWPYHIVCLDDLVIYTYVFSLYRQLDAMP